VKQPVTAAAAAFVVSAFFFVAIAAAIPVRSVTALIVIWCLACVGAVIVAARRLGPLYGVPLAIAAGVALDSFYIPPTRQFGERYWQNWITVAVYISKQREVAISDDHDGAGSSSFAPPTSTNSGPAGARIGAVCAAAGALLCLFALPTELSGPVRSRYSSRTRPDGDAAVSRRPTGSGGTGRLIDLDRRLTWRLPWQPPWAAWRHTWSDPAAGHSHPRRRACPVRCGTSHQADPSRGHPE